MKKIIIGLAAFALVLSVAGIAGACPGEAKAKAAKADLNSNAGSCAAKAAKTETASANTTDKVAVQTAEAGYVDSKACQMSTKAGQVSADCPYGDVCCMNKGAKADKAALQNPTAKSTIKPLDKAPAKANKTKADLVEAKVE